MSVITRFAPSPTGYLHIGGARTALFNWLFAKANGGKMLLRIEDTDRERSTEAATDAILKGLTWLGLDWGGDAISQHGNLSRHQEVAHQMLADGAAYKCFSTQDEIAAFREAARAEGKSTLFRSPWRDTDPADHPDAPFVVRIKAPQAGETVIDDAVQGPVNWKNDQLDDMVLLRSDGTPTYMLAVVVDDHDMGVTHVIRGDDHLANAARQAMIYNAMGWALPIFAHIPLIHGPDGKKLSKRHGALGVEEYAAMGYTPAGLRNYLARLGWSHGDDEIFTTEQAIVWFGLGGIGKAPARLDFKKMEFVNGQQIAMSSAKQLMQDINFFLSTGDHNNFSAQQQEKLASALPVVQERAKTLNDLIDKAHFALTERPIQLDEKSEKAMDTVSIGILKELTPQLRNASWSRPALEEVANTFAEANELKFGKIAAPLRAALAGRAATPSVFDMMLVLGRDESLARLEDWAG